MIFKCPLFLEKSLNFGFTHQVPFSYSICARIDWLMTVFINYDSMTILRNDAKLCSNKNYYCHFPIPYHSHSSEVEHADKTIKVLWLTKSWVCTGGMVDRFITCSISRVNNDTSATTKFCTAIVTFVMLVLFRRATLVLVLSCLFYYYMIKTLHTMAQYCTTLTFHIS